MKISDHKSKVSSLNRKIDELKTDVMMYKILYGHSFYDNPITSRMKKGNSEEAYSEVRKSFAKMVVNSPKTTEDILELMRQAFKKGYES